MNIIALLELISLDKSKIGSFSTQDFTQIKKQLFAEKEHNSEIEDAEITQLLKALKTNPESLQAVLNNRILFNFFTKKNYSRKDFLDGFTYVETEKVKSFVQQFLIEELNLFFIHNLEANKFDEIALLTEAQNYFPDSLTFMLRQYALDKLDEAIEILKPSYGNLFKILYIQDPDFFTFLCHIKDQEVEQKVKHLLDSVTTIQKENYNSELVNKTFLAMNSYIAFDEDFTKKIRSNKDIGASNFEAHIPKKRNLTWVYVVVGLFVFIRIIFFVNSNAFKNYTEDNTVTYEDENEYKPEPRKIDQYYTNMKFAIDSFQVFLTDYKESEIKQMTRDISLKTGDNPFQTFYKNPPTPDSNHFITVTNKTGYDMVLLENTVLYDSIKMPRSAHFIKAGGVLEINFNSNYSETVFNIYLGKKWATFQTNSNHLFIRNHSIVEYRFSELVPASKEILKTDYNFINDAVVSYSRGGLDVDSQGARINPLDKHEQ